VALPLSKHHGHEKNKTPSILQNKHRPKKATAGMSNACQGHVAALCYCLLLKLWLAKEKKIKLQSSTNYVLIFADKSRH
jgi:hypothetical protein